jgi:hypothetical protein
MNADETNAVWQSSITVKRMAGGVTAYGRPQKKATAALQALALRVIADRLGLASTVSTKG